MQRAGWIQRPWLKDVVAVGFLLLMAVKLMYDRHLLRDYNAGDEVFYLRFGLEVWSGICPSADFGPLYVLSYSLLSRLGFEMALLPTLHWFVLCALLPVSLFVLARSVGGGRLTALAAGFLLLSTQVVEVVPWITHAAAVVLALGFALATRCRTLLGASAVVTGVLLTAAYIRPEFFLAFMLAGALLGVISLGVLYQRQAWREVVRAVLPVTVATLLLGWVFGFPSLGGTRSMLAFGQHYARNVATTRNMTIDYMVNWQSLCEPDFGDASTVAAAYRRNPTAFHWHLRTNLANLPVQMSQLLTPNLELRPSGFRWQYRLLVLVLVVSLVSLMLRPGNLLGCPRYLVVLVATALTAVPVLGQVLVVYPRYHYLIPPTLLVGGLLIGSLRNVAPSLPNGVRSWCVLLLFGLFLLAATPNRTHGWNLQQLLRWRCPPQAQPMEMRNYLALVKSLNIRRPVVVLDYEGGLDKRALFADLDYQMVYPRNKQSGFWDFVQERNISFVVLNPRLIEEPRFAADPEFQAFASGETRGQFTLFSAPNCKTRVAVRNDVLSP